MCKITFYLFILLSFSVCNNIAAQNVSQYENLLLKTNNGQFPKVLIYDAPSLPINYKEYNQLGFEYISVYSLESPKLVPNKYKYILWTGIASNEAKAKWSTQKSPFVDDIDQYAKRWDSRLRYYWNTYSNPHDKEKFGVMVLDIEAKKTNAQLEKDPPFRRSATKNQDRAIAEYKTEMERLYRYPLYFAKTNHNNYKIWSSYSDVPVERNWWGIPSRTWEEWITDPTHLNYITHYVRNGRAVETEFTKQLDIYTVSTYFFYNPQYSDPNIAKQYLAYLLFQLEANQEWTKKPIYLYFWFKYQGLKERGTLISKDMVRNSVIFAFMSGADGMVLYDDSRKITNDSKYHSLIEAFIESISTLDKYRNYFTGKVIFYKPDNARDLFAERKTVIRGIEKNGKLLLAANNPFAKQNEVTRILVYYKGKKIDVHLKGTETYLEEIAL